MSGNVGGRPPIEGLGPKKNIRLFDEQTHFIDDVYRAMGQIDVGTASWNGALRECIDSCINGELSKAVKQARRLRKEAKADGEKD